MGGAIAGDKAVYRQLSDVRRERKVPPTKKQQASWRNSTDSHPSPLFAAATCHDSERNEKR